MEYKSIICDECGTTRKICENLKEEIDDILRNHPEWRLETIEAYEDIELY